MSAPGLANPLQFRPHVWPADATQTPICEMVHSPEQSSASGGYPENQLTRPRRQRFPPTQESGVRVWLEHRESTGVNFVRRD